MKDEAAQNNNMRDIKFRGWNKAEKIMLYDFFGKDCYLYWFEEQGYREWGDIERDFIVMQYTGLKDKNGKEIFEGDIIKPKDGFDCSEPYLPVYWDEEFITFCMFQCEHETEMLVDWYDISEVIGNIYENPELIKNS